MAEPDGTLLLLRILMLALALALGLHFASGGDFPSCKMKAAHVG